MAGYPINERVECLTDRVPTSLQLERTYKPHAWCSDLADYVFNSKPNTGFARDDNYFLYHLGVRFNIYHNPVWPRSTADQLSVVDLKGCFVVEIRINRRTKSSTLLARMSGSSSLPHVKTTLAIVLVQPDTKYNVDIGNFIEDSLRLSPTGDVLNKVEVKLGKNRNGTLGGDRKLLLVHRQTSDAPPVGCYMRPNPKDKSMELLARNSRSSPGNHRVWALILVDPTIDLKRVDPEDFKTALKMSPVQKVINKVHAVPVPDSPTPQHLAQGIVRTQKVAFTPIPWPGWDIDGNEIEKKPAASKKSVQDAKLMAKQESRRQK